MRWNRGYEIVCETRNSYKHCAVFGERDAIVSLDGKVTERGDDPKWAKYRKETRARLDREAGI